MRHYERWMAAHENWETNTRIRGLLRAGKVEEAHAVAMDQSSRLIRQYILAHPIRARLLYWAEAIKRGRLPTDSITQVLRETERTAQPESTCA